MARHFVPAAEALLDQPAPVLDKGHVILLDYMGSDAAIVQAARTSYAAGTKTVREDSRLIHHLMRNEHTSPFEQVSLKFHIKLPLFVFAQMVRHRTAKLNAQSARYSIMEDEFFFPAIEDVRGQGKQDKQVGEGTVSPHVARVFLHSLTAICNTAYLEYERFVADETIARELARMQLPQNLYTQIVWKIDLHNLFHFLKLRLDWHAQKEIRVYAEALARCAEAVAPMAWSAFEEYTLYGARMSRSEMAVIRAMFTMLRNNGIGLDQLTVAELGEKRGAEFLKKVGVQL